MKPRPMTKKLPILLLLTMALLVPLGCSGMRMLGESFAGVKVPQITGSPKEVDTSRIKRVAIVVQTSAAQSGYMTAIEDAIEGELLAKNYAVASRSQTQAAMKEMRFQSTGLTAEQTARIGSIAAVDAILIVTLNELSTIKTTSSNSTSYECNIAMSAKLMSVADTSVLWTASYANSHHQEGPGGEMKILQPISQGIGRAVPQRQ